jgi:bifunctional non-homologous end joining protein LigD
LRSGLDPQRFTLRTVPGLLAKSRAWQDYCEAERPLTTAIKRLGKARAA